jgi:hypothetical protein
LLDDLSVGSLLEVVVRSGRAPIEASAAAVELPVAHRLQLLAAALTAHFTAEANRSAAISQVATDALGAAEANAAVSATKSELAVLRNEVALLRIEVDGLRRSAPHDAPAVGGVTSEESLDPAATPSPPPPPPPPTLAELIAQLEAADDKKALANGLPTLQMYIANVVKKPKVRGASSLRIHRH